MNPSCVQAMRFSLKTEFTTPPVSTLRRMSLRLLSTDTTTHGSSRNLIYFITTTQLQPEASVMENLDDLGNQFLGGGGGAAAAWAAAHNLQFEEVPHVVTIPITLPRLKIRRRREHFLP